MASISLHHHGQEREPVIVIDGFTTDPDLWIEDAESLRYERIGDHYPGVRAVVPRRLVSVMISRWADLIRETFAIVDSLDRFDSFYSLVTTKPDALAPIQRLPHFDGVERDRIAILHFLGREELGGTTFYRQRATGFETVDASRLAAFSAALRSEIDLRGLPPPRYVAGDTEIYEQVARYDARFNRALIYRGHTLHCADIPDGLTLSSDPRSGRLTVNTFLKPGGIA